MAQVGKLDVVTAGHACIDFYPDIRPEQWEITSGGLIGVGGMPAFPGGAACNVGTALAKLGLDVAITCKTGDDWPAPLLRDRLLQNAPNSQVELSVSPGEFTSYSIVREHVDDRSFYHCSGTNDTFGFNDVNFDLVRKAKVFHLGYPPLMLGLFSDGGVELSTIYRKVYELGVITSLDMAMVSDPLAPARGVGWEEILRKTLPYVDLFTPSLDELILLVHRFKLHEKERIGDIRSIADTLLDWGCGAVVIKMGDKGLSFWSGEGTDRLARYGGDVAQWHDREIIGVPYTVDVVGKTGSGDDTIAGILAGICRGLSPEDCIKFGNAVGSCSVEQKDAASGVRSWDETWNRIRSGWRPMWFSVDEVDWKETQEGSGIHLGPSDPMYRS